MTTTRRDGPPAGGWTLVVPVKALDRAKSRLARAVDPSGRRLLVRAMATDVLTTCLATPGVSRVRVVTSDPAVTDLAHGLGAEVVAEVVPGAPGGTVAGPAPVAGPGDPLNTAIALAVAGVAGPVGVVTADLPELGPSHLAAILRAAADHPHAVVPDHRGAGTTMAFWTAPGAVPVPRFGADSATRHHLEGGAVLLDDVDPTGASGRDVDSPDDLLALAGRAVGPATADALSALADVLPPHAGEVSATMVP